MKNVKIPAYKTHATTAIHCTLNNSKFPKIKPSAEAGLILLEAKMPVAMVPQIPATP